MDKQTLQSPKLVNPKYFKVPRQKIQINPEIKRSNSWYLNVFLIVTFLIIKFVCIHPLFLCVMFHLMF